MIRPIYFIIIFALGILFLSCESEKSKIEKFEKFKIDKKLNKNDTFKLISKYPELILYKSEKIESTSRTAFIVHEDHYYEMFLERRKRLQFFTFDDYKCSAQYKNDTLSIWLNNYNGYFGNGVLIKVFEDQFLIRDIDPKTRRGEVKFINSSPVYQNLTLDKSKFKRNDSIYGFIKYKTKIDSSVIKFFQGYFRTKIK